MASMKGWNLLALGLAATGVVAQNHSANEPVRDVYLNVPYELYSVKRPIDGSWQSFSIEGGYMVDFFGNLRSVEEPNLRLGLLPDRRLLYTL